MARKVKEIQFTFRDEDYEAFGRYRIMYTEQGHKMVNRQRISYLSTAAMIAILTTVFKFEKGFTILMYVVAAALAVVGIFFAEKLMLRQQDKAIKAESASAERVHAPLNKIRFGDTEFTTLAGNDEQVLKYSDIKLIDFTDCAIYVWMSDEMIMTVPAHAFSSDKEMKEVYKWLKNKVDEQGGKTE